MDIQKIACEILHVEDIALTRQQTEYLRTEINNLPGIEQKALEDDKFAEYGKSKTNTQLRALGHLRADKTLVAVLSLSVMSYDSLINVMMDVITGDYADKEYNMEIPDEAETGTEPEIAKEANDSDPETSNTPEEPVGCYLKALFAAPIANSDFLQRTEYKNALAIIETKFANNFRWMHRDAYLNDRCLGALARANITTNADLIRWKRGLDPTKSKHIPGIGSKRLDEINEYLDFWFAPEKQQLLSSITPL